MVVGQRDLISIHIGQAGVQLGSALWELYCLEHGVEPDGMPSDAYRVPREGYTSFFRQTDHGRLVPMALMVDLEPTVLDTIKSGKYGQMFGHTQLLSGKEDAANNFARGYFAAGSALVDVAVDELTKAAESSDSLQGFFLCHSTGGGTGSGFASLIFEYLQAEYSKKTKLEVAVHPAPQVSTAVVEPYNSVLGTHASMSLVDCSFILDNEALYEAANRKLGIPRPSYCHLNRLVSQAVSSVTASVRFGGPLNVDFLDFQTNLVPFPRIHYPVISYAPIVAPSDVDRHGTTVADLTKACFDSSNQMVKCELKNGKYVAVCLLFRGDVVPKEVNNAINNIKSKKMARFVEWSPTGFKVGINAEPPAHLPYGDLGKVSRSCCMISNTTAVTELWSRLNYKYGLMLSKKAFLHWYVQEGMDAEDFLIAQEDILSLQHDYEELLSN